MKSGDNITITGDPFDERSFVDPDVAALIPPGANVFVGHLTVLQLIKEIRLLRVELAAVSGRPSYLP